MDKNRRWCRWNASQYLHLELNVMCLFCTLWCNMLVALPLHSYTQHNYTWLSFIVNHPRYYVCSLMLLIFASVSWAMVWQASWWNATHNPVKALLCVHTMNCKCCFVFTIVKTLFFNVVLQCLLIYYGYYIWIYLMTQDTMGFFVFFNLSFFFFLLICGCLDCCH